MVGYIGVASLNTLSGLWYGAQLSLLVEYLAVEVKGCGPGCGKQIMEVIGGEQQMGDRKAQRQVVGCYEVFSKGSGVKGLVSSQLHCEKMFQIFEGKAQLQKVGSLDAVFLEATLCALLFCLPRVSTFPICQDSFVLFWTNCPWAEMMVQMKSFCF